MRLFWRESKAKRRQRGRLRKEQQVVEIIEETRRRGRRLPEDALLDELHEEAEDLDELNPKLLEEVNKHGNLWTTCIKSRRYVESRVGRNGRPKQTIGPDELDALISEGKELPAIVAKVDELEANLENHQVCHRTESC